MNKKIDNIGEVIERIKNDPTSIRFLDTVDKEVYEEIYKYYNDELKKIFENIKFISRISIARDPYNLEYLYNKAEKSCVKSLELSTDLLNSLRKQIDSMSIK